MKLLLAAALLVAAAFPLVASGAQRPEPGSGGLRDLEGATSVMDPRLHVHRSTLQRGPDAVSEDVGDVAVIADNGLIVQGLLPIMT